MPILDIFDGDAFNTLSMTRAINKPDFQPGQISQIGIFSEVPVADQTVAIEERGGALALVGTTPRGAPATQHSPDKRTLRSLRVPHIALEDTIVADEVQGIRAFGSENQRETVSQILQRRLERMAAKLDATMEHLRMGAVKGTVLDADGTQLYNLFNEFGVAPPAEVNFSLATDTTKVLTKCSDVIQTIEDSLGGVPWLPGNAHPGVHCFCSQEFWDALIAHKDVQTAYERWQDGAFLRQVGFKGAAGGIFDFGGIRFERYRGKIGGQRFIAADKAHFFPVGVMDLFENYFAPADFDETVNTPGLPRYAKQAPDPEFQRWRKIHVQTNPLPVCTRPGVLVQGRRA